MCCFSGPVDRVADTKIFARLSGAGTQFLVYSMTYAADREVAMILPLPTASRSDGAVQFISLKGYADFFEDMNKGFPETRTRGGGGFGGVARSALPVYEVGDFVASFVPARGDFRRLDGRFTLPRQTWDKIPAYRDYGFAVFQLRTATRGKRVHPMALAFETRMPGALYFPTVHIHDGQVHPREHFDHALYFQARRPAEGGRLGVSTENAARFLDVEKAQGIVAGAEKCFKRSLQGALPNRDTLVRAG